MDKNTSIEASIRKAYLDVNSPAAYSGLEKVYNEARKHNKNVTMKDVSKYLQGENTYSLHKPRRNKFPRLKITPTGIDSDWHCDLGIFDKLARKNNGYKYLLVCVDVLSRKMFAAAVKSKSSPDMQKGFNEIWKKSDGRIPTKLYSDKGLEFEAKAMKAYFEDKGIVKYVMYSPNLHSGIAERANRTIKGRLYKYMTEYNTERWIDVIDKIIDGINNSINRTIGVTPNSVNESNAQELYEKVYKEVHDENNKSKTTKYKEGDYVRINKEIGKFGKSYLPGYTEEIFKIDKVKYTNPPHYKLVDLKGEQILGVFYDAEFSKTTLQPNERLSEVLEERTNKKGKKEYLIHWIGESAAGDKWVEIGDKYSFV